MPPMPPKRGEDEAGMVEKIHLDLSELALEEAPVHEEIAEQTGCKARVKAFLQKHKSLLLGAGVSLGVIVLISGVIMVLAVTMNPLRAILSPRLQGGNVIHSMNTSGTMSANAHYTITPLVAGSVVESVPGGGRHGGGGGVLYRPDHTEALLAEARPEPVAGPRLLAPPSKTLTRGPRKDLDTYGQRHHPDIVYQLRKRISARADCCHH